MQPLIGRYQRLFFVLSSPQVSHLNGTTNCSANRQDGVIKGQQKQAKVRYYRFSGYNNIV